MAARVAQQDLGRPDRRAGGKLRHRRVVLVRDAGGLGGAAGGDGAMLSLVAQVGDLAELAIKRRFGAKDTSTLIPGHGGVMDRVDGLVAAAAPGPPASPSTGARPPTRCCSGRELGGGRAAVA